MIKKMIRRHDLTPVQRQMRTNFDDYYEEAANQGSEELERLRGVIEDRRREKSLGESKLNGNRIEILDLYKEYSENDPDNPLRFQDLPAYLANKSRNYDYLPLTKSTDYNHMIRRSHLNQQAMLHRPLPLHNNNIQRRLMQLRT
jgi:aspartyl-tRNA synthetase